MRMLANNVLISPEKWPTQKVGNILMPEDNAQSKAFARGIVKSVGPGCIMLDGKHSEIEVNVGDRVLYYKQSAIEIMLDQERMHIVIEKEIIAILEPGDFGVVGNETKGDK